MLFRSASDAARAAAGSAREAAETARTEARRAVADTATCRKDMNGTRVIDVGKPGMRIVTCGMFDPDSAKIRTEVVAELRDARNEVARDRDIPEGVRANVIASLDRQIAKWRDGVPTLPEPPAPPAPPRLSDGVEVPAPPAPPEISNACPVGTRHTQVVAHSHNGRNVTQIRCDGRTVVARSSR